MIELSSLFFVDFAVNLYEKCDMMTFVEISPYFSGCDWIFLLSFLESDKQIDLSGSRSLHSQRFTQI